MIKTSGKRCNWLRSVGLTMLICAGTLLAGNGTGELAQAGTAVQQAAVLTAAIHEPVIPRGKTFMVTDFGAVSGDNKDDLPAFVQAVAAA